MAKLMTYNLTYVHTYVIKKCK